MTAEIVLQIFRFGFLLLLWLFIFAAFRVVRADLFGGRAGRVSSVPPRATAAGKKKSRGPRTLVVTAGPLAEGRPPGAAYVCRGSVCGAPTTDPARLAEQLGVRAGLV